MRSLPCSCVDLSNLCSVQTELTAACSDLTAGARERQGLRSSYQQELQQLQGALSRQEASSRATQVGAAIRCQQHQGGNGMCVKGHRYAVGHVSAVICVGVPSGGQRAPRLCSKAFGGLWI